MLLRRTRIKRTRSKRNRLDPNRFDGLPLAKSIRIVDESVLQAARNMGQCEVCGRPGPTDPAHISSRGSGGDDTNENVVAACRLCHREQHQGLISLERFRQIVANRAIPLGAK